MTVWSLLIPYGPRYVGAVVPGYVCVSHFIEDHENWMCGLINCRMKTEPTKPERITIASFPLKILVFLLPCQGSSMFHFHFIVF